MLFSFLPLLFSCGCVCVCVVCLDAGCALRHSPYFLTVILHLLGRNARALVENSPKFSFSVFLRLFRAVPQAAGWRKVCAVQCAKKKKSNKICVSNEKIEKNLEIHKKCKVCKMCANFAKCVCFSATCNNIYKVIKYWMPHCRGKLHRLAGVECGACENPIKRIQGACTDTVLLRLENFYETNIERA